MIAETRHQMILDILHKQRSASVQELAEQLHISESTIRRDLIVLDRQGKLTKVYGGAMAMNMESSYDSYEPDMDTKEGLYVEEKKRMGQYAASLIRADDFVYIDAGTSTIHLVNAIDGDAKKRCTSQTACCTRAFWREKDASFMFRRDASNRVPKPSWALPFSTVCAAIILPKHLWEPMEFPSSADL